MNILAMTIATMTALVLLGVGTFLSFALGNWWLQFTADGDKWWGAPAWCAGCVAIVVPMFFGTIGASAWVFLSLSGLLP